MFTTTSSVDFNLVTAHIVKQISVEQQQQRRSTTSCAAWHISAIQGCTVFLTVKGSRVDSHTRTIPLTKTLRNASKKTFLQASCEQQSYWKSKAKKKSTFKKWCPWQTEQENLWKFVCSRMTFQGVHAKVLILQYILGLSHFPAFYSLQEETEAEKGLPPPEDRLSLKKNQ